ncbi:hypothetical protein [Alkalicoccobacillus plakortidis]|uniref:Beta-galactosidase trimerisation domain-containing protein n=1 Tax=Alkalicoccobacillus plakortidis TaxID=444060 RepID=A0ABT0XPW5_9BACI|nr:hypothetical protein [Alkalicoccobacillus plakortidis]MCM2677948.1 hypothetical protein [Alkalicoccobacillus plakortidis]
MVIQIEEIFQAVKEVFRFHEENEKYFGQLLSLEETAIIKPSGPRVFDNKEYLGIFKMLKEQHKPFDVLYQHQLINNEAKLERFQLVILPDIREWETEQLEVLVRLQEKGVRILATGGTFTHPDHAPVLHSLFNAKFIESTTENDAAYLLSSDRQSSKEHWVFIDGEFSKMNFADSSVKQLPYIAPSSFGPPERAYDHKQSDFHGVGIHRTENGSNAFITWQPGKLYYQHGYEEHKQLFLNVMNHIEPRSIIKTNAASSVEVFINRTGNGEYLCQVLNLSGFNGVTYMEPIPMESIQIQLKLEEVPSKIIDLNHKGEIAFETSHGDSTITFQVDQLQRYEAFVIEMSKQ